MQPIVHRITTGINCIELTAFASAYPCDLNEVAAGFSFAPALITAAAVEGGHSATTAHHTTAVQLSSFSKYWHVQPYRQDLLR